MPTDHPRPTLELKWVEPAWARRACNVCDRVSHLVDELCNVTPNPTSVVGANAFAHKGSCTWPGSTGTPHLLSTSTPPTWCDRRCWVRALGQGTVQARTGVDAETAARVVERGRSREPRLPFEAADGSFDL